MFCDIRHHTKAQLKKRAAKISIVHVLFMPDKAKLVNDGVCKALCIKYIVSGFVLGCCTNLHKLKYEQESEEVDAQLSFCLASCSNATILSPNNMMLLFGGAHQGGGAF